VRRVRLTKDWALDGFATQRAPNHKSDPSHAPAERPQAPYPDCHHQPRRIWLSLRPKTPEGLTLAAGFSARWLARSVQPPGTWSPIRASSSPVIALRTGAAVTISVSALALSASEAALRSSNAFGEGLRAVMSVPLRRSSFHREVHLAISWYNCHRPHMTLEAATPDEVYFARRRACRQPRFEPRLGWPRAAPCARARVLVKGQPGVFLELTVDFLAHQRHLPLVKLTRAA
jgi:hypothetical protein